MIDISTTETLIMEKNFPGSRHKFSGKREISKAEFSGKFPVPTSREETLLVLLALCLLSCTYVIFCDSRVLHNACGKFKLVVLGKIILVKTILPLCRVSNVREMIHHSLRNRARFCKHADTLGKAVYSGNPFTVKLPGLFQNKRFLSSKLCYYLHNDCNPVAS